MLEKISKIKEIYGKAPERPMVVKQFSVEYKPAAFAGVKDNGTLSSWP
jgi:hypothetical protein